MTFYCKYLLTFCPNIKYNVDHGIPCKPAIFTKASLPRQEIRFCRLPANGNLFTYFVSVN